MIVVTYNSFTATNQRKTKMHTQPTIGSTVRFDFPVNAILRKFHGERRTGFGVVVDETVVGSNLASVIRVTESSDYAAGEIIDVSNSKVWM